MFSFRIGLFVFITGGISAAHAQITQPLMVPCTNREQNYRNVQQATKDFVAEGCLKEIKEGLDACLPGPTETDEERTTLMIKGTNLMNDTKKLAESYSLGQAKYEGKAAVCASSHTKVKDACAEISASYLKAMNANRRDEQERITQINQMPPGPERFNALTENTRAHQVINSQLYAQRDKTSHATGLALKALNDAAQCNANQSRLYAEALNPTNDRLASITANGNADGSPDSKEPIKPIDAPANDVGARVQSNAQETGIMTTVNKATETLEHAAENSAGAIGDGAAKTARTLGKASGLGFVGLAVQEGDKLGATGSFITTASEFITPANAAKVGVGATFFTILLHTSSTSVCDVWHPDPVEAYRSGCKVSSPSGAMANENAVSTLASK